ncbi:MAG: membrane protein insertase YidC [Paracoccaceae bacterium]
MDNDNQKNMVLAVALSALVMLVWFFLFPPPDAPQTVPDTATETFGTPETTADAVAGAGDATAADAAVTEAARLKIDTPRLTGTISLQGGRLDDLALKGYRQTLATDAPLVRLLNPVGTAATAAAGTDSITKPYYAFHGWSPAGALKVEDVPGPNTVWSAPADATLSTETPVTLTWDNGKGLIFTRTISVDANYMFTVAETVENRTDAAVSLAPYGIIARHGQPTTQGIYVLHEGAVRMSDGKLQEIDYDDMPDMDVIERESAPAEIADVAANGWVGFTDKYWMASLVPTPGTAFTSVVKYLPGTDIYQTEARLPLIEVAPGAKGSASSQLFAGAKEWETIRAYQNDAKVEGFIDSIDWGWFYFLTKPIFSLLHWLNGAIGNMGWAIIALTFILKLLVFPLARKSYISMAKMKELQPEMEKLKERSGDDRQKMQQEMMALYKREKVNPASGCLPILLQIPIFFALYKVIFVTLELRHAPWAGWIRDLSAPDPSSILNLFGLMPWATPEPGSLLAIISLGVLPILLGISMWLQQKLNPTPTDPTQAAIFAWMPWIFMFMLGSFASGLVLYWITNNIITFVQQYTIMKMHGHPPDIFGNIKASFSRKKPVAVAANTSAAPKKPAKKSDGK